MSSLSKYNLSHLAWHGSQALIVLLLTWFVVFEFKLGAKELGIAQLLIYAPTLILIKVAGTLANSADCRRLVAAGHFTFAGLLLVLICLFAFSMLPILAIYTYSLAFGVLNALVIPAKNAMLSDLESDSETQRAVVGSLSIEFISKLGGVVAAALLSVDTLAIILVLLSAALFVTGILVLEIELRTKTSRTMPTAHGGDGNSVLKVLKLEGVAQIVSAQILLGFFSIGSFLVLVPLVVRDLGSGQIFDVSIINVTFWAGTLLGAHALGSLRIRLAYMLVSLYFISTFIYFFSVEQPFYMYYALSCAWGVGVAVTRTTGRYFLQAYTTRGNLGPALALYQAAHVGSGPLGAIVLATMVEYQGLSITGVITSLALVALTSSSFVVFRKVLLNRA